MVQLSALSESEGRLQVSTVVLCFHVRATATVHVVQAVLIHYVALYAVCVFQTGCVCVFVCHRNLYAQLHPDYPEALGAVAAGELADINLVCC